MKKAIAILAVILTAQLSQAAAVTWNSGVLKTPLANGTFSASNIGAANTPFITVLFFTSLIDAQNVANIMTVGGATTDTAASLGNLAGDTGKTAFSANTTYWTSAIATIVTDGGTKQWKLTSNIGSFTMGGTGDQTINFLTGANMGGANLWQGSPTWVAVPEPTSMALLALGVAAIGLRRKFNK